MTVHDEQTSVGLPTADVRIQVPRRRPMWGRSVRWTRRVVQAAVMAVVGWQALGHVTSGGEVFLFAHYRIATIHDDEIVFLALLVPGSSQQR